MLGTDIRIPLALYDKRHLNIDAASYFLFVVSSILFLFVYTDYI